MARILVVEDEPDSRDMLAELLAYEGYEIRVAENGLVGLEALRTCRVDLVITDVMMPCMDGTEMVSEMRKDAALRGIPVIFVSAGLGSDFARRAGHAFVQKPIAFDVLLAAIRRILGS